MSDNNSNLFMRATRERFRYPSAVGELTTEQLWDLSLTSKKGPSLDSVAIAIATELNSVKVASFVDRKPTERQQLLTDQLEVVKTIIAVRQDEAAAREKAALRKAEREKIMDILARKDQAALEGQSKEELMKRLEALSD